MIKRLLIYSVAVVAMTLLSTDSIYAKKKKAEKSPVTKTTSAYEKLFKDKKVKSAKGLFTIHKIDDKVYFEVPIELLHKRMLMGTAVESVSDPQESSAGMQVGTARQVIFDRTDSLALIRITTDAMTYDDSSKSIIDAIDKSTIAPILFASPIVALSPDSVAIVFDATQMFLSSDKSLDPLDPKAYNSMDGFVLRKATFERNNSMIADVAAFDNNASVVSCLSYKVSLSLFGIFTIITDKPLSANVRRTFMLLPTHRNMPREADSRIGTSFVKQTVLSGDKQTGAEVKYYANRWLLQNNDGKLTKPITFYIDDNLPSLWREAILNGFAQWNNALELAGFKNALQTKMFSEAPDDFSPANIKYSCVHYIASPLANIRDYIWSDPRSGEILSANIYVSSNLPTAIQRDRLLQTGVADSRARTIKLSDELLGESINAMILRNIGHCLGLSDNMAASAAYPSDSLCSETFVAQYGISPSVMDDLPYNYLISKGDGKPVFAQTKVGAYDKYVIDWLYRQENDKNILNNIIVQKRNDPAYRFSKRQHSRAFYDPSAMSLDLGNNAIASAEAATENFSRILSQANSWLDNEDYDYEYRQAIYDHIVNQVYEYAKHVLVNIGGLYLNEKQVGDSEPTYKVVPKEVQRESLLWILGQIEKMEWIDNQELLQSSGLIGAPSKFCRMLFSKFVFLQIDAMWLSESKSTDPYTQLEAMNEVSKHLWNRTKSGNDPGEIVKFQQTMMIDYLIGSSNVMASQSGSSGGSSALALTENEARLCQRMFARNGDLGTSSVASAMGQLQQLKYQSGPDNDHIWYAVLLETRTKAAAAANYAKSEDLKHHYLYLVHKIDKALRK